MKGTPNEGFQEKFINQGPENLAPTTSKSTNTDKTGAVQYPITPIPLENGNVDTDKIEALNKNSFWERMSDDKVRLLITILIIGLFLISVIVGLIMFVFAGNTWLLFGVPVLTVPASRVISYYFPRHKAK
jgi:hypothetical protein